LPRAVVIMSMAKGIKTCCRKVNAAQNDSPDAGR